MVKIRCTDCEYVFDEMHMIEQSTGYICLWCDDIVFLPLF